MALRFMGIGAPKCATTWTYRVLSEHPDVRFPAGKEVNFWLAPDAARLERYRTLMGVGDESFAAGELSVEYARLPFERIREIRKHFPDLRLFINVRHPVDRAWSLAKMRVREGGHDLLALTDRELMPFVFSEENIDQGYYDANIGRWLAVFPADQLLITRYDDIEANPAAYIERLCAHIGVDFEPIRAIERLRQREPRVTRPIPPGIRAMLQHLYAEEMERFRDAYGIDFTGPGGADHVEPDGGIDVTFA